MPWRLPSFLLLVTLAACDGEVAPSDGDLGSDLKGDRGQSAPDFQLVDPAFPLSSSERTTLRQALAVLADIGAHGSSGRQRALATETLARITSGAVRIAAIETARGVDLWHMCKDLGEQAACAGDPPSDPAWAGDEALQAALASELDGYQWGNRLYFDIAGRDAAGLASTLVHEVDHVLNRSECSYYSDYFAHVADPTLAWLEEYRAFLGECVWARGKNASASRCDGWASAQLVEREYGFTPDLGLLLDDTSRGSRPIAEGLFADDGRFGWMIPKAERWPSDFSECETR